jgi:plastocyanin
LDGSTWIQLGQTVDEVVSGSMDMAVESSVQNVVTAQFSHVSSAPLGTDMAPSLAGSTDFADPGQIFQENSTTGEIFSLFVVDDGGAWNLTSTWTQTSGPAPVTFLANGVPPSLDDDVIFNKAGTYTFNGSISDAQGKVLSGPVQDYVLSQGVNIVVPQVATYILVTPLRTAISGSTSEQLTATEYDQFGDPMATQPSFTWSLANGSVGAINSTTGQFTANGVSGTATATVTADGMTNTAVINVPAPTFAVAPHAAASPVTTISTTLSALGASVDGESNLAYTWTLAAGPAPVTFSDNNDNTAKSVTATFTTSGVYEFVCALTDPAGIVTQQTVSVPVVRTETSIFVSPASTYSFNSGLRVFKALALDQFGAKLVKQPKFTWSLGAGSLGSVSRAGVYHAPKTGGTFSVVATSGSLQGSASIVVGVRQAFAWLSDSDFVDAYLAANPKLTRYVDRLMALHAPPAIVQ